MKSKKKAVLSWSGGKDAALALQKVLKDNEYEIISFMTTINRNTAKSTIHAIPLDILKKQSESIGIPLLLIEVEEDLKDYHQQFTKAVNFFKEQNAESFIFGDVSISNNKKYREELLHPLGMEVVLPLWELTSRQVIQEFLNSGIKAKFVVTQADKLDKSYLGKDLDQDLINSFPAEIDVCGENGEYHTLVYDGNMFHHPIDFTVGETKLITHEIMLENNAKQIFQYYQAEIS